MQDVGKSRPVNMTLKPKFYPENVEREFADSITKVGRDVLKMYRHACDYITSQIRLLLLQKIFLEHLKAQVTSGELFCSPDTAVLLASFMLQEEHGNYNAVLNPKGFLANAKVLPNQYVPFKRHGKDSQRFALDMYSDH